MAEGNLEDAIPIKKTSSTVYIAAGVGVVAVLGLVLAFSGGDKAEADAEAQQTEKAADAAQGMTKAEMEERRAHLEKTQAALMAAEAEENADAAKARSAKEATQAEAQPSSPPPSNGTAAPPKAKPADKKKTLNSLDGLGDDISKALE